MIDGQQLKDKFELRWGPFRRFIAGHPLTGFWCGVGAGFVLKSILGFL